MRRIGLRILQFYLKITATLFLSRYRPKVIGVTGSVGKSSTKEAIYTVLREKFNVRRSLGSYNNEIGVPLTIMGEESPGSKIFGWVIIFFRAIKRLIYDKNYPEILVLELGVDKPNDLEYLLGFIKPKIAVITSISPAHLEKLKSEQEIYKEKTKLASRLPKKGIAILNFDDERLKTLGLSLKQKVVFYGDDSQANLYPSEIEYTTSGMKFNINWAGSVVPTTVSTFGMPSIYADLAAVAVALSLDLDLLSICESLKRIKGLKGRLKLFAGKKNTTILDDTYNSNPLAASESLKTAVKIKERLNSSRLVVILGDMLELGKISRRAHINLGREAAKVADMVIAVGSEAKNICSGAEETKHGDALWFPDSETLAKKIFPIISEGDLVLIKGSQGARMEKVSKVLLKNKSDIKHMPRMSGYWVNR